MAADIEYSKNISTQRAHTPPRLLHCHSEVSEHISYKMPYLLRLLHCRSLVSDSVTIYCKNAYHPVLKKVKNWS